MTIQRAAVALTLACFAFVGTGPSDEPVLKPDHAFSAPLYFVANAGQADARALYYAQTPGATVWLTREGLILDRAFKAGKGDPEGTVLGMSFVGANTGLEVAAADPADYRVSYFFGRDESEWKTDIPTSRAVLYKNVYDGIDLKVYGTDRELEYDWILAPGARPQKIRFAFSGGKKPRLDRQGDLVIGTAAGPVHHRKPLAYQVIDGKRIAVDAAFRESDERSYGFAVGAYDPRYELTIDPLVLIYGTYLGGHDYDCAYAVAVDPTGAIYLCGDTASRDFPPVTQTLPRNDMYVTKLSPDGKSLVFTAFFPSSADAEFGNRGLAVDAEGFVTVAGSTSSPRFPMKSAFQPEYGGGYADGVVLKLAKSGKSLVYSSYIGGMRSDYISELVVDAEGAAYVAGNTQSPDFPTKNAFQKTLAGNADGFLAKVDAQDGGLVYSTFLGSSGTDFCGNVVVGLDGSATVAGVTTSRAFPLKSPLQKTHRGGYWDAFITRFAPSGRSLVYSTYLGGTGSDWPYGLAEDADGAVYIAGATEGSFPLKNAFQKVRKGSIDGYVAKIAPYGKSLVYASYLGGSGDDLPFGIAVDGGGAAYVTGSTTSLDFPVKSAYQPSLRGSQDGFLTVVAPSGTQLLSSTFVGGSLREQVFAIALDKAGAVYLAGRTNSPDLPTKYAYQKTLAREFDAFVLKFKLGG